MQKNVGVRTLGLSTASKHIAVFSVIVALSSLLIGPFVLSTSYGSSFVRFSPDVHNRTLTSPNAQSGGGFGVSAALSGNLVVVGAPHETASGYSQSGNAYIFNLKTGALVRTLSSPNAQTFGLFGYSVAISGNIIVVGAYDETASGYGDAGHAYIFNAMTGSLMSNLTSPNMQSGGEFGYSVATNGSMVVVGAPFESASGFQNAGDAYTFNAKTGALIREFTSPNVQANGWFGLSVAASNNLIVVGAPDETICHVYTFNSITNRLTNTFTNTPFGGYFGWSVAASGNIVVAGAPYTNAGQAYAFNTKTGALTNTFTSPNAVTGGEFGFSVAASGKIVAIGAYYENASGYTEAGHAYTFNTTNSALISTFTSPNAQTSGRFGSAVAISGKVVEVGAYDETALGFSDAGHAYIF